MYVLVVLVVAGLVLLLRPSVPLVHAPWESDQPHEYSVALRERFWEVCAPDLTPADIAGRLASPCRCVLTELSQEMDSVDLVDMLQRWEVAPRIVPRPVLEAGEDCV